jgi:transcriptional regulator with XRE-family HTH domain
MNRTAALVETLKKYLKAKGMTYKQLADELKLSEASVKRMFSKQRFSLSRLDEICRILDIDFYDLVLMDKQRNQQPIDRLTNEQEESLLKDEKLWIFLYFLLNGWTVKQIVEDYQYAESEAIQMLAKLDK